MEQVQTMGIQSHPKASDAVIVYGTAGFRTRGDILDHVMYRMGALAVLRSKLKSAAIGVMVTASHNPEADNGVKLVDPKGEMLEQSWESLATKLANAADADVTNVLDEIVAMHKIPLDNEATVFVGRDTRKSSPTLSKAAIDGVQAAGGVFQDFGVVSTPQLHFLVVCNNTNGDYGEPTEDGYFKKISGAFVQFMTYIGNKQNNYKASVKFDGANGVGASKMHAMASAIKASGFNFDVQVVNDGTSADDVLNFGCGADYVKVQQGCPKRLESVDAFERCVSVDGDADRVVYFFKDNDKFQLMDGDKIATLVAGYFKELFNQSQLNLNLGLVQTAYANGSSTKYITEQLNVPVACVPTGVKHLHHKAQDFDIGVYFEANGHGTAHFSAKARSAIKESSQSGNVAGKKLEMLMNVINETVGDAISDMLLVECILAVRDWSVKDWAQAYQDLPNRLMKVKVADRTVFQTTDAERVCVKPEGLQDQINKLTESNSTFRSFVRPSGTEDAVRVYAEADTRSNADSLALQVCRLVFDVAGGVGERP